MSAKSKIDQQLSKILSGDISELLDSHKDESEEVGDELEQVTELVPIQFEEKESKLQLPNEDIQEDYQFARSNLYGLVGRSNAALELALKIGAMSEHPRALEVAATLIKMSSEVTKELISIHREVERTKAQGAEQKQNSTLEKSGTYTQINNYYANQEEAKDVSDFLDDLPDDKAYKDK